MKHGGMIAESGGRIEKKIVLPSRFARILLFFVVFVYGVLFGFEDCHEGALRDVHLADFLHLLLALFLLFPKLPLSRDVAAIAFCGDVLRNGADGFTPDDLSADRSLDRDFEELLGNHFLEFRADGPPFGFRFRSMDQAGKCIDRFFIDADLQLYDIALAISVRFIVEGTVTARNRFELVVEIGDDLVHRQPIGEEQPGCAHRLSSFKASPFVGAKSHDRSEIFGGSHNVYFDPGFFDEIDVGGIGISGGIVDFDCFCIVQSKAVDDARGSGDDVQIEFAA